MAVWKSMIPLSQLILAVCLLTYSAEARIHKLKLENDDRNQIDLSTFGFLKNGYLAVNITNFSFEPKERSDLMENTYGFTLDKTVSTGISPYLEGKQGTCILTDTTLKDDDSVSVLFLRMDLKHKKLLIERKGEDLKNLQISQLSTSEFQSHSHQRRKRSLEFLRDSYLLHGRVRREAGEDKESHDKSENTFRDDFNEFLKNKKPQNKQTKPTMAAVTMVAAATTVAAAVQPPVLNIHTRVKTVKPATPDVKTQATTASTQPAQLVMEDKDGKTNSKLKTEEGRNNTTGDKHSLDTMKDKGTGMPNTTGPAGSVAGKDVKWVSDSIPLLQDANGRFSTYFLVSIGKDSEQGLYNLFFHNCHNYGKEGGSSFVNFTVYITETNKDNYLSAGQMPLPMLYFSLCGLYFLAGCYWFYVVRSSEKETVFKIHYLMLTLVFVKSVALLFHAVNFYFIQKEGHHEEAFAILYYITHLMKGALLFITIVLIGAGWAFIKHILSDRDKKIFIIVIPLQILANVAQIIIEETEEGQSQYTTWKEVFILVDLLCCGAILFPVVWSIRHLQEASTTDGKAAINLAKLKIFRHFYIMIVCYIYFTRIIVYLLKITVPFQYEWLDELFKELATFVFFTVTGYKFRPASNNPYLQVPTDSDDEIEMDEVVTKSGALDDVVRVNVRTKPTDVSGPTKRESSHEYD